MLTRNRVAPSALNASFGAWLIASGFLWPHSLFQGINTWVVGLLAIAGAMLAAVAPITRYWNALLAIWLFVSAYAGPTTSRGTVWNNALLAIAMFIVACWPRTKDMDHTAFGSRAG